MRLCAGVLPGSTYRTPQGIINYSMSFLSKKKQSPGNAEKHANGHTETEDFIRLHEMLGDVVFRISSPDRRLEYVSAVWRDLLGPNLRDADINAFRSATVSPETLAEVMAVTNSLLDGRDACTHEYRSNAAAGFPEWVRERAVRICDSDGNPAAVLGAITDISSEKKGYEALARSEERHRSAVEESAVGFFRLDAGGILIECNTAYSALVGNASSELIGCAQRDLTHPDDLAREEILIASMIAEGRLSVRFDKRLLRADGGSLWIDLTMNLERDEAGTVSGYTGFARDITGKKYADLALRRSEERYRALSEASPDGIFIVNSDKVLTYCNSNGAAILGISAEAAYGRAWPSFFPDDGTKDHGSLSFSTLFDTTGQGTHTERRDDRHRRYYDTIVVELPTDEEAIPLLLAIARDITDRKAAEDTLRDNEHRYRTLFDLSPSGIIIEDAKGTILDINPALSASSGFSREELIGRNIRILVPESEHHVIDEHIARILGGEVLTHELVNVRKDGSLFWIELRETALTLPDGTRGIFGICNDITLNREAKDVLVVAKESAERSDRLKDIFIANISHEIRTPLNVIIGFVDLLSEIYRDRIEAEHMIFFHTIERSGRRLLRTVEHILNISSIQAGVYQPRFESLNISELVQAIATDMHALAEAKNLALECTFTSKTAFVSIDRYTMEQALINLLDNAIKFTDEGGVTMQVAVEDEWARIDVSDSGIGISDEYLPRIFEKFSQESSGVSRPFDGLGLGMALTRHYVEVNKGMISIDSKKGRGTSFTVYLPLDSGQGASAPRGAAAATPISAADNKKEHRVLVVEDDTQSQQYMALLLSKLYQVRVAPSASQAWAVLESDPIDLVLMDISLHGDIDGLQFTRLIRQDARYSMLPVIALTAHAFPADRQRCLDAGCNEYLAKPFQRDHLLEMIARFLA